jgi:hypothetical protein
MSVKEAVTGLMRVGDKAFGSSLVKAAQQKNRENLEGQVVARVQDLLVHLQKQRDYRAQTDANIALLERKLHAIESGAFTLSPYGVLTFNDVGLERGVVAMAECTNCGHQLRRKPGLDPGY